MVTKLGTSPEQVVELHNRRGTAEQWITGSVQHWSLRSIQVKLIKIGAKVIQHARYVIFQMAEVAVPKELFTYILARIGALGAGGG